MKRLLFYFLTFALLPLLSSCLVSYGDTTSSSIVADAPAPCTRRADRVQLFYDGEPVNFRYERVGLVEAQGEQFASNDKVMDFLRYKAWHNCADAIIAVRKNYKDRTSGTLFDSSENETNYSAPVFSGIAVRIVRDSTFEALYPSVPDTSFVSRVRGQVRKDIKRSDNQLMGSLLMLGIGSMAGVVYYISQDK
jgi:hypothetical protein